MNSMWSVTRFPSQIKVKNSNIDSKSEIRKITLCPNVCDIIVIKAFYL